MMASPWITTRLLEDPARHPTQTMIAHKLHHCVLQPQALELILESIQRKVHALVGPFGANVFLCVRIKECPISTVASHTYLAASSG